MEKKDIALKQLRASAKHYNQSDYVCSITLSGAAEEILGRIAKERTKTNQLDNEVVYLKSVYEYLSGHSASNKELIHQINAWVETDFENEAALLFVRAVKNYFLCYKELPSDRIVRNLFEHLTL
jgi:hypothetical protein